MSRYLTSIQFNEDATISRDRLDKIQQRKFTAIKIKNEQFIDEIAENDYDDKISDLNLSENLQ